MTLTAHDDHITTNRLHLRRMTEADLPFFTRIHADPEVARYIGLGRPRSVEETRTWFDHLVEGYGMFGLGQLAVIRKSDGALIGRCGISYLEIESTPADGGAANGYFVRGEAPAGVVTQVEPELGYTFDRSAWGQGFAREAAASVFAYVTGRSDVDRIVSLIHPDNVRSRRVALSFSAAQLDCVRAFGTILDRYVWPTLVSPAP